MTDATQALLPVTPEDNEQTIALSEWLFTHGFFDEDGSPQHQKLWEEFGSLADQTFARHRDAEARRCAAIMQRITQSHSLPEALADRAKSLEAQAKARPFNSAMLTYAAKELRKIAGVAGSSTESVANE